MKKDHYTKEVYNSFKRFFPQGWIDKLYWQDNSTSITSLKEGMVLLSTFRQIIFINYSKLVLAATYFAEKEEIDFIDKLDSIILVDDIVPDENNKLKAELQSSFLSLLQETHEYIRLLKYYINITKKRFEPQKKTAIINAISYNEIRNSDKDNLFTLFDRICDACWQEYVFSNDEGYIRSLLITRDDFKRRKSSYSSDINSIIDAIIEKLTILLHKLSVFSKNKSITSNFDLHEETIALTDPSKFKEGDFRAHFLKFMDVKQISQNEVNIWQQESLNKDVSMWQFVFLMRYYVKQTKTKQQIENLISLFEKHYDENNKSDTNPVDKYACRSVKNYMYNSRFSYMCQYDKNYSFEQMRSDLEQIEAIQNDTFIFSFHPFQKAIEYVSKNINTIISGNDKETASLYLDFLKESFNKFKNNVEWCRANQPYFIQSRFKFSTINLGTEDSKIMGFCPSTFCRPLKFETIDEKQIQYNNEISFLSFQVEHMTDKIELQEAKDKVNNMERRNLEVMALFVTVTTFLVGVLSIFIGNKEGNTILDKIEYVIALGIILLLFICVGYFVLNDIFKKHKPWIMLILTIILLASLFYFSYTH